MQLMNLRGQEEKFLYLFARMLKNPFDFGKNKPSMMDRREALALTTMFIGGTIIGSQLWLSGCSPARKKTDLLSNDDIVFLDAVGETILPKTDKSPGAKEAHIGEVMKTIVTDCYHDNEQMIFMDGMGKIK